MREHRLVYCTVFFLQLCNCSVVQLYSCTIVQLYNCTVVQLYSCTIVQYFDMPTVQYTLQHLLQVHQLWGDPWQVVASRWPPSPAEGSSRVGKPAMIGIYVQYNKACNTRTDHLPNSKSIEVEFDNIATFLWSKTRRLLHFFGLQQTYLASFFFLTVQFL
jgi:hypothetical protein